MPRRIVRTQPGDEVGGLVEHGDLGVAEPVDRLLAVADHEDRRRQGAGRRAEAFAPASDEQRHELPLRAVRILEFVDQHVLVPRLELVPALRELLHLLEQADGAGQHFGKIEDGVGVERPAVLRERNLKEAPDPARKNDVQVAAERPHRLFDRRRDRLDRVAMPLPRRLRHAVLLLDLRLTEPLGFARLAVLREEVGANPIDEHAERRLHLGARVVGRLSRAERRQIGGQHRELRMADGTLAKQRAESSWRVPQQVGKPFGGPAAGDFRREIARPEFEEPPQHVGRHEPPAEQRRQSVTQPALAQLHEHHRHVGVGLREMTADAQRPIERFADEPRDLRLVRQVEARIDVGFERELADERQTERVNRRDGNLAQAIAHRFPSRRRQLRGAARLFQPLDDPLPHFGGGLSW